MNNTVDLFLTRDDTQIIKGLAVILMIGHHLLAFPDRLPGTLFSFSGLLGFNVLFHLGAFGRICIGMFSFLGGYGKYIRSESKPVKPLKETLNLYKKYWQVFLVFIPVGFLFFGDQAPYCVDTEVCTRYSVFSVKEFLLNLFGLQSTYNLEWWFLLFYVICILTFPLISYLIRKHSVLISLLIVISLRLAVMMLGAAGVLAQNKTAENILLTIDDKFPFFICFYAGILTARCGLYTRLADKTAKLKCKPLISIIIIVILTFIRRYVPGNEIEFAIVFAMVFASKTLFDGIRILRKPFSVFGKYSTNMWLIHSFFCYYFGLVSRSLVFFRWGLLAFAVLTAYTFGASVLLSLFWNAVEKGVKKLAAVVRKTPA